MQGNVFVKKLRTEGVHINVDRLYNLETGRVIPPHVGERSVSWPDETWWQVVAALYLLDTCGWTVPEVRIGRFYMEEALVTGCSPVAILNKLAGTGGTVQQTENYQDSFAWAVACIKVQKGWPLLAPAEITVHHGPKGLEYELEKSFTDADTLQEDGHPVRHPVDMFLATSKEDED